MYLIHFFNGYLILLYRDMKSEKRSEYQKQYRKQYKSKRVSVTLSPDEYRLFSRYAKSENTKITTAVKQMALSQLQQQPHIPREIASELTTLRFAIHNIANNVNQMAHYSHTIRNMTMQDEHSLLAHLKQLNDVIESYTKGQLLQPDERSDHDH